MKVVLRHTLAMPLALLLLAGCATETSTALQAPAVAAAARPYAGLRVPVSIGKFEIARHFSAAFSAMVLIGLATSQKPF